MTGPEHYRASERYAKQARDHLTEEPADMRIAEVASGLAIAHATLALAAAVINNQPGAVTTQWYPAFNEVPA